MLLESCAPGERPAAFYRVELKVPRPRRWFDELNFLLDRGLIGPEEARVLDIQAGLLSKGQGPRFCEAFESGAGVREQGLGVGGLRYLMGEFSTAARWHRFRERPELEDKYKRLSSIVETVLREDYNS